MSPTGPTAILALSPVLLGGLAGLIGALGVLAIASALRRRRPTLLVRLDPYVHQRAAGSGLLSGADAEGASMTDMLLAMVTGLGSVLESMGSSAAWYGLHGDGVMPLCRGDRLWRIALIADVGLRGQVQDQLTVLVQLDALGWRVGAEHQYVRGQVA